MTGCCALGTCVDPACYLCTVVAKMPQSIMPVELERETSYAEPAERKKEAKHPMWTKRDRRPLELPGLRAGG